MSRKAINKIQRAITAINKAVWAVFDLTHSYSSRSKNFKYWLKVQNDLAEIYNKLSLFAEPTKQDENYIDEPKSEPEKVDDDFAEIDEFGKA